MSFTTDQVQQRVQQTLQQFERLALSDDPPGEVLKRIAELVAQTMQSSAVLAWMPQDKAASTFAATAFTGESAGLSVQEKGQPHEALRSMLQQCVQSGRTMAAAADQAEFAGTPLQGTTQFFVPIHALGRVMGVLHLVHTQEIDPSVYRQYIGFAQQGSQCAGTYLARRQSQVLQEDAASSAAVIRMTGHLLNTERVRDLLHEAANQTRPVLEAERVAVIGYWAGASDIMFSDALETSRKAVLVRAVEVLAEEASDRQVPMSFTRGESLDEQDAHLAPLLEQVFDQSSAEAVCLTPLRNKKDELVGVMWAEYATADQAGRRSPMQQELSQQIGPILSRTIAWEQRPLRRLSNAIAAVKANPTSAALRAVVTTTIITALVYVLCFHPVALYVRADAKLEPAHMAVVAAPEGGQIDQIHVHTGQLVAAGQVLAEMDTREYYLQLEQVQREMEAERVELQSARSENDPIMARAAALRLEQLQVRAQSLDRKIERAQLRSQIDGVVLTQNPHHLRGRNISQGESVVQVADLSSFALVMEVKEEDLTLVEKSLREERAIPVQFLSRPWPDLIQQASITDLYSLSPTSAPDEHGQQHVFQISVPVDLQGLSPQLALANPTGRAKLDVGESSVAYRYGRRVWRFIQMTVLF